MKVFPWQQQEIHFQTFTFEQIPIYFQEKSLNLVELSFSLPELWAENLRGGAEYTHTHTPGIGLRALRRP